MSTTQTPCLHESVLEGSLCTCKRANILNFAHLNAIAVDPFKIRDVEKQQDQIFNDFNFVNDFTDHSRVSLQLLSKIKAIFFSFYTFFFFL